MKINLVTASSYSGKTTKSDKVKIDNIEGNFEGKNVLIVDDILDTGKTLIKIREEIGKQNPKSVSSVVLLKKARGLSVIKAEYVGFDIFNIDSFVVGYGLDYDGYYRNLPDIMTLKKVNRV